MGLYSFPYLTAYDVYVDCLRYLINFMVLLSVFVALDRLSHVAKYLLLKLKAKRWGPPESKLALRPLPDPIHFSQQFPKVAVQLPMFNERAVCQSIIEHACKLEWPRDRFCVQVLDDSTDEETRRLVDEKCQEFVESGVNCYALRRTNRKGYKAGAMKEGTDKLSDYEYIAVFDADFKPDRDFLYRTVPYIHSNPQIGYVQTRWIFTNPDESLLTRAQEINLNFHMKCEQWTHFATGAFFNFNGTAGIWRKECIEDVGGWNARTTVEDMDLSLRAYLAGWKGVFLDGVTVLNEIPSNYFAYRKQQHRWTCGPVQLWKKASQDITNSKVSYFRKLELSYLYFGIRKISTHLVNLGFFCFLVPLSVFTPEVSIPLWALVHLPITVTITTAFFTAEAWYYSVIYVLFENAMGIVKINAVISGFLGLSRANEWVVTQKMGSFSKASKAGSSHPERRQCSFYPNEMIMCIFILSAAVYSALYVNRITFSVFLVLQGMAFGAFGLNMVDADGLLGRRAQPAMQK
eukprot:TRINITY_DN3014_c0_g1_i1.p1 TRINITY_DN3014_c0_g1~~TRINITY_DN3014_c0_g1_i1.p1  ORF type:complete len:518 (-),score=40.54 TRINITY_DN3014_c0_g1_i1:1280-2833(-)